MKIKDYPYLYETHLHTNLASACAHNSSIEMVDAAAEAGYSGIIITEHNWYGNTSVREKSWERWVDAFVKGYTIAKDYTKNTDFDVFWGYEAGYNGTEFLIYGITPTWLKEHPEIIDASVKEQYDLIHSAGGIVVHAHPFREEFYIPKIRLFPDYVDAVEGINATHSNSKSFSHNNPNFDKSAIEYARANNLPITAGSDIHTTNLLGGGVAFKERLSSIDDYCKAILGDTDYRLTNGETVYDRFGEVLYQL